MPRSLHPVLDTPNGADVLQDWEYLYLIAKHMGLQVKVEPYSMLFCPDQAKQMATELDMDNKPTDSEFWRILLRGSPVSYDEARKVPEGKVYPNTTAVQPKPDDWKGRLQLAAAEMMSELQVVASEGSVSEKTNGEAESYPFKLLSMRMRYTMNSSWRENPKQQYKNGKQGAYNPVLINPSDLDNLGIKSGDVIQIQSSRATIQGVAESSADIKPGCVSMSHGWGNNPDEPDTPREDWGLHQPLVRQPGQCRSINRDTIDE